MPDKQVLFKDDLKEGMSKFGLFLTSASPTLSEQLSFSGYDWLLVDMQNGPMEYLTLSAMLSGISNGKALSMVRVSSFSDQAAIQQAIDLGASGVLIPSVKNAKEVLEAISYCFYPSQGTRSVFFPMRSSYDKGFIKYVEKANKNTIFAVQIETKESIDNIEEILSIPELDIAFLGRIDLSWSMGLHEKYNYSEISTSKELKEATQKLLNACKKYQKIPGLMLTEKDSVEEFLDKGFQFISVGNEMRQLITQCAENIKKLENISHNKRMPWKRNPTSLF